MSLKSQQRRSREDGQEVSNQQDSRTLVTRRVSPTFELQTLHTDLSDVRGGTGVVLPDFGVNSEVRCLEDQKGSILLLQGQQHLQEEEGGGQTRTFCLLEGDTFPTSWISNLRRTLTMFSAGAPLVNDTLSPETFTFSPSSRSFAFSEDDQEKTCQASCLRHVSTLCLEKKLPWAACLLTATLCSLLPSLMFSTRTFISTARSSSANSIYQTQHSSYWFPRFLSR